MTLASTKEVIDVPQAWRDGRLVAQVVSLKCRCKTVRHALTPVLSELKSPADHEVRCYQCDNVLAIWLSSGRRF